MLGLIPGSRVGPYEVTARIGAGGMGEVYRARDAALGRDVALKVLPPGFAADADRLARFDREARVLASLNHPNIAAIYGLEALPSTDGGPSGQRALVLEFIDGESLDDHIRATAGPRKTDAAIREALAVARQIADALDAAHERGIIHRDLKPANIKFTREGAVKVLDFGLARAERPDADRQSDLANSPTITSDGTRHGVILGTAAYMSPEQARPGARQAHRHLVLWLRPLRNADVPPGVRRRDHLGRHCRHSRAGRRSRAAASVDAARGPAPAGAVLRERHEASPARHWRRARGIGRRSG